MVLEYLPGGDLFDGLVSRPFYSEKDACACAHQIITALNYLSMKGIIHRVRKDTRGGSSVNGLVTFSQWWGLQLSHILNGTLLCDSCTGWSQCESEPNLVWQANFVSGKDETNPALWLTNRAILHARDYALSPARKIPRRPKQKPYNKSFIDQDVWSSRLDIGVFFSLRVLDSVLVHKHAEKKNLSKIDPAILTKQAPSITHICTWMTASWRIIEETAQLFSPVGFKTRESFVGRETNSGPSANHKTHRFWNCKIDRR